MTIKNIQILLILGLFFAFLNSCISQDKKTNISPLENTKTEFDSCSIAKPFENVQIAESSVGPDYSGELTNYFGTDKTKIDFKHIFKHGKLTNSIFYFENGKIQEEYFYKCGALQGNQKYYYENGALAKVIPYSYGYRQGTAKVFDDKGILRQQVVFVADSVIGEPKNFDEKGNLIAPIKK